MSRNEWTDLDKCVCPNHYDFKIKSAYTGCHCPPNISFSQCAFDMEDEAIVAIDNNGIAYYIDMSNNVPAYKKLGCVGISTTVAFNPTNRNELLIGLSSTNIKIVKISAIDDFCSLTGHTAPPSHISFFRDHFLTASSKEVIVWQLKTYCKAHQLRLNVRNLIVKKAIFSSLGLVAVLYQTNLIQCWTFQQFGSDNKIDVQKYGLKIVKDFEFTKDGRAMIVCGLQNKILVFNTTTWEVIKNMDLHGNFSGGKQLSVVPVPLDGGANSIVAVLTSDCSLKFVSLTSSSIVQNCCDLKNGIKRIAVSHNGYYLVYISIEGFLDITLLDKVLNIKSKSKNDENKRPKNLLALKAEEQLSKVRLAVKEELKLSRLLPILKEFGEYPEKHRRLIWATIMELPNNKKAYISLSNKVPHEAMFDLLKNDPLLDKCKSSLLGTTVSCLLHWCPVLAECLYLPKIVAPFVMVYQKNPILAFETSIFILLNHCQKWFEYHPLPPLNILGMMENILLEADPSLFNHFCERGITSTTYAWPLLQSMMSEVLSSKDWLILWDHLLSVKKPWYLLMCTVAYNILYRKTITTKLKTLEDFQQFYKTQGHVSVKMVLKIAHKLDSETPHRIHPRRYLENDIVPLPKKGPYPPFVQFEFPKYLTDELRGVNLKKLKEKERRLRGFQLHALELLEEKRIRIESENFVRRIHDMRLNELRKCYENQVFEDERLLEYARQETEDLDPSKYLQEEIKWSNLEYLNSQKCLCKKDAEQKRERSRSKSRSSKSLQEQVDRLEFEVQSILTKLRSSSRSRSRIR
ncbi:hypothetical protein QAD02_015633 [Eretmocerus hayati]|uniref:Uncharacterized protein n=1 Tax=Eretmocerus hayati TaxID=131215 RepID=A0ACC2PA19_9HYME|nr:hypothetical protein QAD02_015633 [Eretmocerus hayati]